MRHLAFFLSGSLLLVLLASCTTTRRPSLPDRIVVKDSLGRPVSGATVLFDQEVLSSFAYYFTPWETRARMTDSSGRAMIDLRKHLWYDGTYRFIVRKAGYQESYVTVKNTDYRGEIVVDLKPQPEGQSATERPSAANPVQAAPEHSKPGVVHTRTFDPSGNRTSTDDQETLPAGSVGGK
jgi:hypothetical protein